MSLRDDLDRIARALDEAALALRDFTSGAIEAARKQGGSPVTEADLAVNRALLAVLPRPGEGWLSEESKDNADRLSCERVWVVDPIDGTKEFVTGIPEWCVSVGLVIGGEAVAGGILNPATGQRFLGARGLGVTLNGAPAGPTEPEAIDRCEVLASRSEVGRGEWERFEGKPFRVRPCGSVAFKLALVAAGLADATWTLVPKNEWDVAAGAALVEAGGGRVRDLTGRPLRFNRKDTRYTGLVAGSEAVLRLLAPHLDEAGAAVRS